MTSVRASTKAGQESSVARSESVFVGLTFCPHHDSTSTKVPDIPEFLWVRPFLAQLQAPLTNLREGNEWKRDEVFKMNAQFGFATGQFVPKPAG